MNTYSREFAKAQMQAAPKRVTYACSVAWLLGFILALRVLLVGTMSVGKSLPFVALILFNFIFGGMSVLSRSRIGFVLLVFFAALPLPGSFAYSIHLLVWPLTGESQTALRSFSTGLFGLAQFTLIVYLLRNLFSREVLAYVWKRTQPIGPAASELQTDR